MNETFTTFGIYYQLSGTSSWISEGWREDAGEAMRRAEEITREQTVIGVRVIRCTEQPVFTFTRDA